MSIIKEFNLFSNKPRYSENKLKIFLQDNYEKIISLFRIKGEGLQVDEIEPQTDVVFTVSYKTYKGEMPSRISYYIDYILEDLKKMTGDDFMEWRFDSFDPFTIKFSLSRPL